MTQMDVLYAVEASRDYDPGSNLERIRAPLLAVNSADDLINPPELGILRARGQARPAWTRHRDALTEKTAVTAATRLVRCGKIS